ncbi:ubiquitin domain-containing protein 7SL RNA1 [Quercus suber]|uniref:Ubiquitin domain-containing protein 7sl rna1 n=1 Tax=Quercus suber TaxID=58331 RepID=A0AAW0L7D2_QUESU|nr:ubiquitin domain-containing protein 7SL RNA1-like [Quercus suber]POF25787.1 polyubiquitin 3 [Quercus suber]
MDVIFEPQRGRPFSIEVGFFDTISEIKEKVKKYQGILVSKQTLIFNGIVLKDDLNVEHTEILQNSHIQLMITASESNKSPENSSSPSKKIQLSVKIPTYKMHVPLEMEVTDTVGKLKEKIQEMEALPVNRLMIHSSSAELQDHRSLCECEISENSDIDVSFRPSPTAASPAAMAALSPSPGLGPGLGPTTLLRSKKLKLLVLPKCRTKKIPVEMNASDNVGELRKELQKLQEKLQFSLPQEGYFFIYKQNVMDDDRSFRWHHVGQGDTIEVFNRSVTGGS